MLNQKKFIIAAQNTESCVCEDWKRPSGTVGPSERHRRRKSKRSLSLILGFSQADKAAVKKELQL